MRWAILAVLVAAVTLAACSQQAGRSGEELFKEKCSGCHPDDSRFEEYKGEKAEKWKDGIQLMIDKGRVKLTDKEIEEIAKFLEEKYAK